MEIQFNMVPVAKARPRTVRRNGRTMTFTPKKTEEAECFIKEGLKLNGAPYYEGPISVTMTFVLPYPKKRIRDYPIVRAPGCSDIDNYIKTVLDSMNEICFNDDSQVVDLHARKMYGENSCVILKYEEHKS